MPSILCILLSFFFFLFCNLLRFETVAAVQILSKSKLEKCEKMSDSKDSLNCTAKILINMAVPSGSSGGEASIVAEIVEVEENSTDQMRTLRIPPVVTVNKSSAYALYDLTYIRDVPYKPEEFFVKTRKCEPDAGANVVKICERLRDENGHIMEQTQPTCCPCGPQRRMPSSCGNIFDKMLKGKANTAHCLRFPGDWFHVFGIGKRTIGFTVRIEVKTGSKISEVTVGPENRTVTSNNKFLRVNLIGDFAGYTNIPTFEDFYLVTPRQGGAGQPQHLGSNFSMWMLLERVRFTLDGVECNKIGLGYEAFNGQPNFCSSPFWSCLHNQLWNFLEADRNRLSRKQVPLYGVEGRFERINNHPNAGSNSFSIGVTEVLNTNILIELTADDIEYVYQRSPGKISNVTVPAFETLTQFGVATITAQNTGELEASYSLTMSTLSEIPRVRPDGSMNNKFNCTTGVGIMEEQFFIMKPKEIVIRSFKIHPTTDQAVKYFCVAILKDSEFNEVDRAECQFSTTATVLDNGTQVTPFQPPKTTISGFFESVEDFLRKLWKGLTDFITGRACRSKCSGFFDISCHIQYICMSWVVFFGLLLAIVPTVCVLLWLLHEKGLFDPLYDWWEDHFSENSVGIGDARRHKISDHHHMHHHKKHDEKGTRHHKHHSRHKRGGDIHHGHRHNHTGKDTEYYHYLHQLHKDRHKHKRSRNVDAVNEVYLGGKDVNLGVTSIGRTETSLIIENDFVKNRKTDFRYKH